MRPLDIAQVTEVETESFPTSWPPTAFRRELQQNRLAKYLVAAEERDLEDVASEGATSEDGSEGSVGFGRLLGGLRHLVSREGQALPPRDERLELIVGFMGLWLLPREAHIVTMAVRESHRRRGIGERLLISAIELAQESDQDVVALECRVSNEAARALYEKYGFQQVGLRPKYYSDNREDAHILSVAGVRSGEYRSMFAGLEAEHGRRFGDYDLRLSR
jgi:ribosomal-protein-alanine N-acetyltransferase